MRIQIISTFLFTALVNILAAQTDSLRYPYLKLDRSFTSTNVLIDFGLGFTDIEKYSGAVAASRCPDILSWRNIYASLQTSVIKSPESFTMLKTINTRFVTDDDMIDVALLVFDYDEIKPDAVTSNLLRVVNNQLYDVAGRTASPYLTKTVAAASPEDTVATGLTVRYRIRPDMFYTNRTATVKSIAADWGNGAGYQPIPWNTAMPVTYTSEGVKSLAFKITYTTGAVLYAYSQVTVRQSGGLKAGPVVSDHTEQVQARRDYPAGSGNFARGQIDILYGNNNGGQLRKPFIVVEGFDVWQLLDDRRNEYYFNSFNNDIKNTNLKKQLLTSNSSGYNYDIIFLNLEKGYDYIQANAYLLERTIEWVNEHKVGNEPNVVCGLSMGGLVARYALADMEKRGIDHQTSHYVSMDSPHQGANVPLGLQSFLFSLRNIRIPGSKFNGVTIGGKTYADYEIDGLSMIDQVPMIGNALSILTCPAAQQMLIVQESIGGTLIHDAFMAEYKALGYPRKCRNIAVSNGSMCGKKQGFAAGDLLFSVGGDLQYNSSSGSSNIIKAINIGLTNALHNFGLDFDFKVWSVSTEFVKNKSPFFPGQKVYDGEISFVKKKTLGLFTTTITLFSDGGYYSGSIAYDNAPGGAMGPGMLGGIGAPDDGFDMQYDPKMLFCFVPIFSAFDIVVSTDDQTQYACGTDRYLLSKSPFDMVHASSGGNDIHAQFFSQNELFSPSKTDFVWNQISNVSASNHCTNVFTGAEESVIVNIPLFQLLNRNELTYKALQTIVSPTDNSYILDAGKTLNFIAGESVTLLPGFDAKLGSVINADVAPKCIWQPVSCPSY